MTTPSSTHKLENALRLEPVEQGLFRATASVDYEANTGMFGGLTACLLLNAVLQDERVQGTPSALTVNYVKRITPGNELHLRTTPIGGGRSISHWRAEIYELDGNEVLAYASVIMAQRRESTTFVEWTMPKAPAPGANSQFSPPGTFGQQMQISPISGFPPFNQPSSESMSWVKEKSGRAMDALQLTYLSDVYPPRIWYAGTAPRPSATLTLSVYFHATSEEMAAVGDDYVLSHVTGTRGEHSTMASKARLWSPNGQLLATTEQLCWFK